MKLLGLYLILTQLYSYVLLPLEAGLIFHANPVALASAWTAEGADSEVSGTTRYFMELRLPDLSDCAFNGGCTPKISVVSFVITLRHLKLDGL